MHCFLKLLQLSNKHECCSKNPVLSLQNHLFDLDKTCVLYQLALNVHVKPFQTKPKLLNLGQSLEGISRFISLPHTCRFFLLISVLLNWKLITSMEVLYIHMVFDITVRWRELNELYGYFTFTVWVVQSSWQGIQSHLVRWITQNCENLTAVFQKVLCWFSYATWTKSQTLITNSFNSYTTSFPECITS